MYKISNIKPYDEKYNLTQVNCMERPFVGVLHSFNPIYRSLFLMLLKLSQCYIIREYEKDAYIKMDSVKQIIYLLKHKFNIDVFEKALSDENFCSFIEKCIDNSNPVFVVGNLKELYYSKYYKTEDWAHLFLIKAYNHNNRVFTIIDATQNTDDTDSEFYITYDILKALYNSFNENICSAGVFYMDSKSVSESLDVKVFVINVINTYCNELDSESDCIINNVRKVMGDNGYECDVNEDIFRLSNYKQVFFYELIDLLKRFIDESEVISKVENRINKLVDDSKSFNIKLVYNIMKNNDSLINQDINSLIFQESEIKKELISAIEILKNIEDKRIISKSYSLECNMDSVITEQNDGEFIFEFIKQKEYNDWVYDQAPKIVFPLLCDNDSFYIKADFEIIENTNAQSYMFGVYIKTALEKKYFWGMNCGISFLLENTGVNAKLTQVPNVDKSFSLGIGLQKSEIVLFYKTKDTNEEKIFTGIKIEEDVTEYGIESKTWDKPQKLKFCVLKIEHPTC